MQTIDQVKSHASSAPAIITNTEINDERVVSVQVIPVIFQEYGATPQFSGPNNKTTGWSIYTRGQDGIAAWAADCITEQVAMVMGSALAASHNVSIEPQPWKVQ